MRSTFVEFCFISRKWIFIIPLHKWNVKFHLCFLFVKLIHYITLITNRFCQSFALEWLAAFVDSSLNGFIFIDRWLTTCDPNFHFRRNPKRCWFHYWWSLGQAFTKNEVFSSDGFSILVFSRSFHALKSWTMLPFSDLHSVFSLLHYFGKTSL